MSFDFKRNAERNNVGLVRVYTEGIQGSRGIQGEVGPPADTSSFLQNSITSSLVFNSSTSSFVTNLQTASFIRTTDLPNPLVFAMKIGRSSDTTAQGVYSGSHTIFKNSGFTLVVDAGIAGFVQNAIQFKGTPQACLFSLCPFTSSQYVGKTLNINEKDIVFSTFCVDEAHTAPYQISMWTSYKSAYNTTGNSFSIPLGSYAPLTNGWFPFEFMVFDQYGKFPYPPAFNGVIKIEFYNYQIV